MKILENDYEKSNYRKVEKKIKYTYITVSFIVILLITISAWYLLQDFHHLYLIVLAIKDIFVILILLVTGMFLLFLLKMRFNDEYHA